MTVQVFDYRGRLVRTLLRDEVGVGPHEITWNGRDNQGARVSSGIYFYRIQAGDFTSTKRMFLLKMRTKQDSVT